MTIGNNKLFKKKSAFETWMAPIAFLLIVLVNCMFTPNFATWFTIRNIFSQSASTALIAIGMTLVIASGGIDISVGSGYCWNAVIFGMAYLSTGSLLLSLLAAMASAVLIGALNGMLVAKFRIQPMIATMTMMYILRSLSKVLTNGRVIRIRSEFLSDFVYLKFFNGIVPVQFILILIPVLLAVFLVKKTPFGLYIEACGDNMLAAKTAGVKVLKNTLAAYVICNVLAAMGGIFDAAMVSSVDSMAMGIGYEMDAIAATVIGGTPISGGKPNIVGSVFGVFILRVIIIMINMNNIPEQWSYVVSALVIIVAVFVQNLRQSRGGG